MDFGIQHTYRNTSISARFSRSLQRESMMPYRLNISYRLINNFIDASRARKRIRLTDRDNEFINDTDSLSQISSSGSLYRRSSSTTSSRRRGRSQPRYNNSAELVRY